MIHKSTASFLVSLMISFPPVLAVEKTLMDFSPEVIKRVDLTAQPVEKKNMASAALVPTADAAGLVVATAFTGRGYAIWRMDTWLDPESPVYLGKGSVVHIKFKANGVTEKVNLRLRDAKGEYLQLKAVRVTGRDWVDGVWLLDESSVAPPTWGDGVDGKIDFPLRDLLLAIDGQDATEVTLGSISIEPPAGWVSPLSGGGGEELLTGFEKADQARVELPLESTPEKKNLKWSKLTYAPDQASTGSFSLKIEGETEGSGYGLWDLAPYLPPGALERISEGAEIRFMALSPDQSVRFALRFLDRENENLQVKSVTPLATWGLAKFSLTPENIGVSWGTTTNRRFDTPLRSMKIAVDAKGPFTVYLDDMKLVTAESRAGAQVRADIDRARQADFIRRTDFKITGLPAFAVFTPADKPALAISYETPEAVSWTCTWFDAEGRRGPLQDLGKHGKGLAIPLPCQAFGPMAMEITGRVDGKTVYTRNIPYSIVHPATWKWEKSQPMLGICTHIEGRLDNWSDLKGNAGTEIARLYRYLGASHDRGELLSWAGTQTDAQTFNWERKDRVMNYLKQVGVRAMHIYAYTPYWACVDPGRVQGKPETWSRHMVDVTVWTNYLVQVALRYRDQVDVHELWNEPNIGFWKGSLDDFSTLALEGYRALAAVDPGKPVVVGGYAQKDYDRIETLVAATKSMPWAAFHAHGTVEELIPAWDKYQRLFTANGYPVDRLINSETGMTTVAGTVTITNQALNLVKKLSHQLALGLKGVMWYDLLADGPLPEEGEHHYGIVAWDRTLKPAFAAYNNLIQTLGGATALQPVDARDPVVTAQFRKGEDVIAVLWNQKDKMERTVRLEGFSGKARVLDLYGNPLGEVAAGDGIAIGTVPKYLVAKGTQPFLLKSGRLLAEPMVGAPVGEMINLPVSWREDLGGMELRITGAGLEIPNPTLTLPKGKGGETILRLKCQSTEAVSGRITLLDNGREIESLGIRVTPAPRISRLTAPVDPSIRPTQTPDLIREKREYVKELLTWVGGKDNELWEGPADLSGRLFLGSDDKTLSILVEVRDSQAVEPGEKPEEMWMADSLQLALDGLNGRRFEIGAALRQGNTVTHVWSAPAGFTAKDFSVKISRENGMIRYLVEMPLAALGRKPGELVALSALANDADKKSRKAWLEFGGGIGSTKDPAQYLPWVLSR